MANHHYSRKAAPLLEYWPDWANCLTQYFFLTFCKFIQFEVKVLSKNILDLLNFLPILFNNHFKPSIIELEPRIEVIST